MEIDYIDDKGIMSGYLTSQEHTYSITFYLKDQQKIKMKVSAPDYATLLQCLTSSTDILDNDFMYIETTLGAVGIKTEELSAFTICEVEEDE